MSVSPRNLPIVLAKVCLKAQWIVPCKPMMSVQKNTGTTIYSVQKECNWQDYLEENFFWVDGDSLVEVSAMCAQAGLHFRNGTGCRFQPITWRDLLFPPRGIWAPYWWSASDQSPSLMFNNPSENASYVSPISLSYFKNKFFSSGQERV